MDSKYTFKIEKAEYHDRIGRDLRLYACKEGNSFSLPILSREELKNLAITILKTL